VVTAWIYIYRVAAGFSAEVEVQSSVIQLYFENTKLGSRRTRVCRDLLLSFVELVSFRNVLRNSAAYPVTVPGATYNVRTLELASLVNHH
jgi:hypothetical protein